jgi:hypothetical protein
MKHKEIVVAIDSSASALYLPSYIRRMNFIIRIVNFLARFKRFSIHVIWFDYEILYYQCVLQKQKVRTPELRYSGTNVHKVFNFIHDEKIKPNLLCILTDGEVWDIPKAAYNVVWLVTMKNHAKINTGSVIRI